MSGYLVSTVEECAARALEIVDDPALGQALGRRGKEHVRTHFLTPRYLRDYLQDYRTRCCSYRMAVDGGAPLVLVSNRGPVTYQDDGSVKRGHGRSRDRADRARVASRRGLDRLGDDRRRRRGRARARRRRVRDRGAGRRRLPRPLRRLRRRGVRPLLQHLRQPDALVHPALPRGTRATRRTSAAHEVEAFEFGYNVVNEDLADAVLEEIDGVDEPVVMVHDYQLYTLPGMVRRARPDAFLHHFVHIPWTQSDAWRVLPSKIRDEIYHGLLANDIIGFHTRSYRRNFLQCCRDLLDLDVDMERGVVRDRRPRGVGPRLSAADRLPRHAVDRRARARARVRGAAARAPARVSRSCASTAPTCPRTSCAGSPASTSSSSSTPSSSSGSRSRRS